MGSSQKKVLFPAKAGYPILSSDTFSEGYPPLPGKAQSMPSHDYSAPHCTLVCRPLYPLLAGSLGFSTRGMKSDPTARRRYKTGLLVWVHLKALALIPSSGQFPDVAVQSDALYSTSLRLVSTRPWLRHGEMSNNVTDQELTPPPLQVCRSLCMAYKVKLTVHGLDSEGYPVRGWG